MNHIFTDSGVVKITDETIPVKPEKTFFSHSHADAIRGFNEELATWGNAIAGIKSRGVIVENPDESVWMLRFSNPELGQSFSSDPKVVIEDMTRLMDESGKFYPINCEVEITGANSCRHSKCDCASGNECFDKVARLTPKKNLDPNNLANQIAAYDFSNPDSVKASIGELIEAKNIISFGDDMAWSELEKKKKRQRPTNDSNLHNLGRLSPKLIEFYNKMVELLKA